MKKTLKVTCCLLIMATMTLLFSFKVQAATCGCGTSSVHSTYHTQKDWISNGARGHRTYCFECVFNGHKIDCPEAVIYENEAHTFNTNKPGEQQTCSRCGYSQMVICSHTNVKWDRYASDADENTCVKVCQDCKKVMEKKSHVWKCKESATFSGDEYHEESCGDCGYTRGSGLKLHTFAYKYTKFAVPRDPRKTTLKNSMYISASMTHTVKKYCSECGYTDTYYEDHTFKGNTCTKCKLTKENLGKVSKLKGKQSGKGKHSKQKVSARWIWDGIRWIYRKAGTWHTYAYKVKISCKKPKNAYGFIASVDKNTVKTGTSIHKTVTNNYYITNKSSVTYAISSGRKLKSTTIYVAPVSKYGFIGKVSKVKVKLK